MTFEPRQHEHDKLMQRDHMCFLVISTCSQHSFRMLHFGDDVLTRNDDHHGFHVLAIWVFVQGRRHWRSSIRCCSFTTHLTRLLTQRPSAHARTASSGTKHWLCCRKPKFPAFNWMSSHTMPQSLPVKRPPGGTKQCFC